MLLTKAPPPRQVQYSLRPFSDLAEAIVQRCRLTLTLTVILTLALILALTLTPYPCLYSYL